MKIFSGLASATFLLSIGCSGVLAQPQHAVLARTYYVSSTSGDDKNDGLSAAHAWRHVSKIFEKSNSADPFRPGDSILLKRNDHWDGQIRLQANGTDQKPVTIGAYGIGSKPVLYGDNPDLQWQPVAAHLGIYTANMGTGSVLGAMFLSGKSVRAIYPGGSLNRSEYLEAFLAELQSGTFAGQYEGRLWVRTGDNELPHETVRVFRSAGVMLSDSSYVVIENLDIERFYTGIDATKSQHILVHHNDIQDVLGIGIYLRSADVDCLVESNTVHRSGNTALYVLKGDNNTFRDNWVSHVDATVLGIQVRGDKMGIGLQESEQSVVEYNYFTESGGMDFFHEHDSNVRFNFLYRVRSAGSPNGTDLNVYGNVYDLGGATGKRGATGVNAGVTGAGTINIFNNTIVNAYGYFLMGDSKNAGRILFSDNLLSSTASTAPMIIFGANVESVHNCFFTSAEPTFNYSNQKFSNLESYQKTTGLDADSIFADPQFRVKVPVTPLDYRTGVTSACNSSAHFIRLPNGANARTYDHDRDIAGAPIIGAFRVDRKEMDVSRFARTCKVHCFGHPFTVPSGVYLVRLRFSPAVLSETTEFRFALNGRKVVADFDSVAPGDSDDPLRRDFIVRPNGHAIVLEREAETDISVVTDVDIRPFDTVHGRELQVVAW